MPNIVERATASLAAGATASVLVGTQLAQAPFNGYLEIGAGGGNLLQATIIAGGQAIANGMPTKTLTTFPTLPGELDIQDEKVWAGTPIILKIYNPTAGALSYWTYVRLSDEKRGS